MEEKTLNDEKLLYDIENSIKISKDFRFNDTSIRIKDLEDILGLIHRLQSENEEWEKVFDISNERKYRKKFDEEWKKEYQKELDKQGEGIIAGFPDFDLVYKLYFEQKAEIERLKEQLKKMEYKSSKDYFDFPEDAKEMAKLLFECPYAVVCKCALDTEATDAWAYWLFENGYGNIKKHEDEIKLLTEEIQQIKGMTTEQVVESEKLKNNISEAVNSFVRLETLYKIKCKELEIANKKLEELKGGKID